MQELLSFWVLSPAAPAIAGRGRAVAKKDVPQEEHKYVSVSQLSFEQRIENFNKLIDILRDEPLYDPTEADLTICGDFLTETRPIHAEMHPIRKNWQFVRQIDSPILITN